MSRLPATVRPALVLELSSAPSIGVYDACFRLEPHLGRRAYHQLLRWADSLAECHECYPRLHGPLSGRLKRDPASRPTPPADRAVDLAWTPAMATGIEAVDRQHRQIVKLAHDVRKLFGHRSGPSLLADIRFLIDYTRYHFATEEHFIARISPGMLDAHAAEHRRLVRVVEQLWEAREQTTPEEVFETLCEWVLHHIGQDDMAALGAGQASA
jgi:hemerythrin-like metal-binding protein